MFEVLTTRVTFLEPSNYCTGINLRLHLSHNECFWLLLPGYSLVQTRKAWFIRQRWTFIFAGFKSHTLGNNTQRVSASNTTILPTTVSIYRHSNCFGHVIHTPQTSKYKNIAKCLTHPTTMGSVSLHTKFHCSVWNHLTVSRNKVFPGESLWCCGSRTGLRHRCMIPSQLLIEIRISYPQATLTLSLHWTVN